MDRILLITDDTGRSRGLARDLDGNRAVLFQDNWSLRNFTDRNEDFEISDIPIRS